MKKYEKEIVQAQLDNEKVVLKQLESNYKDALEEIDSKIANLMGRADADMQHVIYQVEYQRALKAQTESILLQLQTNEFETVSEYLTKCYNEGFLGTMYSMQSQGIPLVFPINQEEVVAAIQHETNLTTSLYKAFDMKDLQKKIAGEISRGFSTGASFKEVARNVAAAANISKNKAMRIARTEGHRITETAAHNAQQKAKDRGADVVKVWDSALDSRTRPSHVKVDGEIRELDEKFSNGLKFPGDPSGSAAEVINCRCRSRTDARWALDADETKILGDTTKMSEGQRKAIADKLGIPVEDIDLYKDQVVPINAKNYADFKRQYNKLWQYEGSELQKTADPAVAKLEQARTGAKSSATSNKGLVNTGKSSIIGTEMKRESADERAGFTFISDKRFDDLTINAKKNGAVILRGTDEIEQHLAAMGASAATIGDTLLFMKDVCVSEVLEETRHFTQNIAKMNNDKGEPLRTILNEIDAKQFILDNAAKYKVPRNELDLIESQLQGYKNQLVQFMNGGE